MTSRVSPAERASILEGLESADEEMRRMSVEQLVLLPEDEAIPRLVDRLGDEGWRVRKAAVEGLVSSRGDASVQEHLIRALADGDNPGRRNSAFEALVACGARVTERLVRELESDDADVRKLVIDALAAIGDAAARAGLVEAVRDADPNVRGAAAEALGVIGGRQEMPRLVDTAIEPDEEILVRLSALRALAHMEAEVSLSDLRGSLEEPLLRPAALAILGTSEEPAAIDELLKALDSFRVSTREAAMEALLQRIGRMDGAEAERVRRRIRESAGSDDRLVSSACHRLESVDLVHRLVLVQFLGLLGDERAILPILRAARDEGLSGLAEATLMEMGSVFSAALESAWEGLDFDLKRKACRVLGRTGGPEAGQLLVSALNGPDPELRCEAALALGRGGHFDRVPDLVRCLEAAALDDALEAREEVSALIEALVEMAGHPGSDVAPGEGGLIEILSGRLGDALEPVRLAVARVLGRIGQPRDEPIIGYLLKDESPAVRRAAVLALSRLSFDLTEEPLRLALVDESGTVRIAAAQVLGESGRLEAVEDLRPLLLDEDPHVVAVALRAIGRLHAASRSPSDEVYAMVRSALEATAVVALAGCESLLEMGGPEAASIASLGLDRPESEVVRAAVACLAAHGGEEAVDRLIELVGHPDWSVRAEVIQLLVDRGARRSLPALLRRLESEKHDFVREVILRATRRLEE